MANFSNNKESGHFFLIDLFICLSISLIVSTFSNLIRLTFHSFHSLNFIPLFLGWFELIRFVCIDWSFSQCWQFIVMTNKRSNLYSILFRIRRKTLQPFFGGLCFFHCRLFILIVTFFLILISPLNVCLEKFFFVSLSKLAKLERQQRFR